MSAAGWIWLIFAAAIVTMPWVALRRALRAGVAHKGRPGRNVWGLADRPRYHIYLALFYVVVPPLLFLLVWSGLIARSWYQSAVDDAAYRLSPTVEDLGTTRTRISQLAALSAEEVQADPFNRDMMAQLGHGDSQAEAETDIQVLRTLSTTIHNIALFGFLLTLTLGLLLFFTTSRVGRSIRLQQERYARWVMLLCSLAAIMTTLLIVVALFRDANNFFKRISDYQFIPVPLPLIESQAESIRALHNAASLRGEQQLARLDEAIENGQARQLEAQLLPYLGPKATRLVQDHAAEIADLLSVALFGADSQSSSQSSSQSAAGFSDAVAQRLAGVNEGRVLSYENLGAEILAEPLAEYGAVLPHKAAVNRQQGIALWTMGQLRQVAPWTWARLKARNALLGSWDSVSGLDDFLLSRDWAPISGAAEVRGQRGSFGGVNVFWGTLFVSFLALLVAVPIGLMSAIYLNHYARPALRNTIKPVLEILAGVPTIVYGVFALLTLVPWLASWWWFGQFVGAKAALAAGMAMGFMLIPFITSLTDDALSAVPAAMSDGAFALGATSSETIVRVLIPAALPGIVGGILLATSRAVGETMIVVLAAGQSPTLTLNPFASISTVTVEIVDQLTGDTAFGTAASLSAFGLGLVLFIVTLMLNFAALSLVRRFRESYE